MSNSKDSCRLCGAGGARLLFESHGFPIMECRECGVTFTAHVDGAKRARDLYAHEYYERARDYANSLRSKAETGGRDAQEIVNLARRFCKQEVGRVLDVGCGGGGLLRAFHDANWDCYGIEPSGEMAEWTRERVRCCVFSGLLDEYEQEPNSFDVVTAIHVLEHATAPRRFLERCSALLRPRGIIILEVPDFGSRAARRQGGEWVPLYPEVHLYHFTKSSLTRSLRESGFVVRKLQRRGGTGIHGLSFSGDSAVTGAGASARTPARVALRLIAAAKTLTCNVPLAYNLARTTYWQWLGFGEYLRCVAAKN